MARIDVSCFKYFYSSFVSRKCIGGFVKAKNAIDLVANDEREILCN